MEQIKRLLAKEPVALINAVVAVAVLLAGLGVDVDPTALGTALASLLVLAGVTREVVWSPASKDAAVQEALDNE